MFDAARDMGNYDKIMKRVLLLMLVSSVNIIAAGTASITNVQIVPNPTIINTNSKAGYLEWYPKTGFNHCVKQCGSGKKSRDEKEGR